jgi:cellulose 1,4-beta-cellobiosidase
MVPGEFEEFHDAQYNKAQDEKRYIHLLGEQIAANGMPNHAIVDTSRNGRVGLRTYGGNWCNVNGAGFGIRPTSETDDDLCDAFVWVKVGGESDGGSDPSLPGYDPTCANRDGMCKYAMVNIILVLMIDILICSLHPLPTSRIVESGSIRAA